MSVQHLPVPTNPGTHRQPESCTRAVFLAEQRHLGAVCDFPGCDRHAEQGARMCDHHVMVRLASNGSWVDDNHTDGGHG
ncbi:MAG TPA: hypothetical protein VF426_13160 [Marmoricola sp.]|jgi:hypothetical protein